jgi:hypothetical protein
MTSFVSLFIPFLFFFVPALVFILLLVFVVRTVHRMERRADERLKLEQKNTSLQQQQMREISERLTRIENLLKDVE